MTFEDSAYLAFQRSHHETCTNLVLVSFSFSCATLDNSKLADGAFERMVLKTGVQVCS